MKLTVKDHGGIQGSTDSIVYVVQNGISNDSPSAIFSYYNFSKKKLNSLTRAMTMMEPLCHGFGILVMAGIAPNKTPSIDMSNSEIIPSDSL